MSVHARTPPRDAAPRWPVFTRSPLTSAGLARRSPTRFRTPVPALRPPVPAPLGRSGHSPSSPRPARARKPRGGGWFGAATRVPGAVEPPSLPRPPRGSRKAIWLCPPGRGPHVERPLGYTCPQGPTHIRSGTSRRPSTIMSGRKSSLKAEVMFAAHAALGGRAVLGGRGAVRASERPRAARRAGTGARGLPGAPPEPALVTFSPPPSLRQSPPKSSAEAKICGAPGAESGGGAARPRAAV